LSYQKAAALLNPKKLIWRKDPARWAAERADIELWSAQRNILQSVADHPRTAVQSCHQIGKSFSAATTVSWWLDTHDPGDAFVLTTAPTGDQVKAILWREINRLHSRIGLPGRVNLTEWYMGNELVALGRKPGDNAPTNLHGTHAKYFLVVIDEACGVPRALWDAASTLTGNIHSRTLAIGNPDDATTEFGNVCLRSSGWNVIKVGAKDTPNFTGEPVSKHLQDMLVSQAWYQDRLENWGADTALFKSKCDGEFSEGADPYTVIPLNYIRSSYETDVLSSGDACAGIDIGAGNDRTVIVERRGGRLGRWQEFVDSDPMQTIGKLVHVLNDWNITHANVDNIGVGWALTGRLKELSKANNPSGQRAHNAYINGVNFGAGASEGTKDRFANKRAEVWWNGRENLRKGMWNLTGLSKACQEELSAPRYKILDSYGRVQVEAKEDVIKRLGRSPDQADALLLAFHQTQFAMSLPPVTQLAQPLLNGRRLS
jgi:hypothetical protein